MKRITLIFIITLVLTCAFTLTAFAKEENSNDFEDVTLSVENNVIPAEDGEENTSGNFFSLIYEKVTEHSAELFSLLTFIGSFILTFAYKKGLIPALKSSLGLLSGEVGKLRQESEKRLDSDTLSVNKITAVLSSTENSLKILTDSLTKLEADLDAVKGKLSDKETVNTVMTSQVDMLYEIFMSSSLPHYQKEAVGEKISLMKRLLSQKEKTDDEEN